MEFSEIKTIQCDFCTNPRAYTSTKTGLDVCITHAKAMGVKTKTCWSCHEVMTDKEYKTHYCPYG